MKIKRLEIDTFRHLDQLSFNFGQSLTVIAGGNGTGKTSLLGLIGHIFKFGSQTKRLNGKWFETKFSEVFRFSPDKDHTNVYRYTIIFENDSKIKAESRQTIQDGKPRYRIDVGGRVRGGGKKKKPVIYLSLKRLLPLAQENTIKLGNADELTTDEKIEYKTYYNQIFTQTEDIVPLHTASSNKQAYLPTSPKFDSYGVSAGQDNIGQIILALLEFNRLKNSSLDYDGGVLLIDEIDATLYPAAQKNLVRLIYNKATELDLQVIFTTHSSDLLNFLASREGAFLKHGTNFIGLTNANGPVEVKQGFNELTKLLADLNHEALKSIKPKKINVYFEDKEAALFYNQITSGYSFNFNLDFKELSLSCGTYKTLLEKGFEEFNRSIIVLDGDFKNSLLPALTRNVVFLPGTARPENVIRQFLESLDETDMFWRNDSNYTKRVFFQKLIDINDDRESMKRWFNNQLQYWGEEGTLLFNRWKQANQNEVDLITTKTKTIVEYILTNYYEISTY